MQHHHDYDRSLVVYRPATKRRRRSWLAPNNKEARSRRRTRFHPESVFSCPLCHHLLLMPVTVECGHTFCQRCLVDSITRCPMCNTEIGPSRCTDVLLKNLIEKWQENLKIFQLNDYSVPTTCNEPNYHFRSGFVKFEMKNSKKIDVNDDLIKFDINLANEAMLSKKLFNELKHLFKKIEYIKDKSSKKNFCLITIADLECILCSRCILEPVTTHCGHTFCRGCLTRVLDHRLSCPLCMSILDVTNYSRGSNIVLDRALKYFIPTEYTERLLLDWKEIKLLNNCLELPVFVCTNAFPGVACPLYVYEPRYRLLVRRCLLSSNRKFAMAAKQNNGEKFVSYGTVLEVKDSMTLADGSFILNTLGIRRFKVITRGEQDGYDTANIEYISDVTVATEKLTELIAIHTKVYNKASKWVQSLTPKVFAEVERLIGLMPEVENNWFSLPDGPSWTWWLMPILPLSSQLQVGFLSTTNLEKRLRAIDKMLEHMKIRMKALERNTMEFKDSEDISESCSDFEIPFTN